MVTKWLLGLAMAVVFCSPVFWFRFDLGHHEWDSLSQQHHNFNSTTTGKAGNGNDHIPNLVHFVYVLEDPASNFSFEFSDYLSIFASWHYWKPEAIYLHTNALQETVDYARKGYSGKWSKRIFNIATLKVIRVAVPTHADNGVEITRIEHKSDFVRVRAIQEFGGVYLDFDAHPLRDIRVLRESGFNAIGGRQFGGQVASGTFMSKKGSKMINLWAETMHQVYNGEWTTHSNDAITWIGERLVADAGEMLIMEWQALIPGSWHAEDCDTLYSVHNDTAPSLGRTGPDGRVLALEEDPSTSRPTWATEWSRTYVLHAFNPNRCGGPIRGFNHITPRYVMEKQSNFARAVFPIAVIMHRRGLLEIDDSHQ